MNTVSGEALLGDGTRRLLLAAGCLGVAVFFAGAALDPGRTWSALLVAGFYVLTLALAGLVFLALTQVANAGWTAALKRVPEAFAASIPVGGAALLGILPGAHVLYHWTHEETIRGDAVLAAKAGWLCLPFFAARMAGLLAIWVLFAFLLRRNSLAQDRDGSLDHTRRNVALSAGFLVLFGVSFSVATFDWLMSLEPHWFSTIFGLYNIAGLLQAGVTGIAIATIYLRRAGRLPAANENHLHDLGKLMFGFSTMWAYLWFSQYMLIWYSNLPEETSYYLARTGGGWGFLFWMNVIMNWALPFLLLLPRPAKRSEANLLLAGLVILVGRWLDIYLMVAPSVSPEHTGIGLIEILIPLGPGAFFLLAVAHALGRHPLEARHDPYLIESVHLRQ